ncbi:type 4b pilus protein PilO2 [Noviherbaspirillum saxi]|uniref:Pilus assembly protein n=1 Tax=Noviherbaspirillum saxi TaxID=2320863 RepID=A0A3A3FKT8_9BURK|nr:type 4b pilus protein PilO2 [Noviherbaspirillum saxi]RJF92122.1 pilus assembly protein [Noviherbaspirillum saxi]
MAIHIIQDGKTRLICGLFWQSLSRPRDLRAEALTLAKKINFDLMVLRRDQATAQAGYANSKEGGQSGMISLAAAAARTIATEGAYYDGRQQPAQNWLGAFQLADGKWAYFAVRDGNFLPNGDYAGTREEVLERLHGDYGLGGWNVVIGEPELESQGFHNFNARRISELVPRKHGGRLWAPSAYALRPVARQVPWKLAAGMALASVVLGSAGYIGWRQYQLKKEEEERARAMEEMRRRIQAGQAAIEAPHPWPAKPLPEKLARACAPELALMSAGGWQLDELRCTPTQIAYAWSRGSSSVGYLLEQVPQAIVDISGAKASLAKPLSLGTSKDEALLESKGLIDTLLARLQSLGVTPKIALLPQQLPPPPPPSPPGVENKLPQPPSWKSYSLTINAGSMPPADVASILIQPGVRLEQLTYRAGEWVIEGVIYAK